MPVLEYVLKIKAIMNSLLAIGDIVTEEAQTNTILDGLLEEYNPFVMQIYGKPGSLTLYDVKTLLCSQEAQLDKFRQESSLLTIFCKSCTFQFETRWLC